jgi:hypothetical protein
VIAEIPPCGRFSFVQIRTVVRNKGRFPPETVMTLFLVSVGAFVSWRAGVALQRVWSALPDRNLDFDLTAEDVDLERRA